MGTRSFLVGGELTWLASEASPYLTDYYSERKGDAAKLQSRVNFKAATRPYFQHCRNMD
jgi:hypothetical protein